jgi:PAS domain S-box-containing protein
MKKILVVDDNQQNLYFLKVLLSANGFEVELASNGEEALTLACKSPPYMIVSDILMPVMDGYALCKAWRENIQLKNIPFIFYSATYTEQKDQDFALKLGADRFIVKPVDPNTFMSILIATEQEFEAGKLVNAKPPIETETYYKEYNEVLIHKLEDKMFQLEETNRALEVDIAARKKTEDDLRIALVKYKALFDSLPLGITVLNNMGKLVETNTSSEILFCMPKAELLQHPVDSIAWNIINPDGSLMPDSDYPCVRALKENCVIRNVELGILKEDDTVTWLSVTAAPLPLDGYGVVVTYNDITERKQGEEKQKKLEEQLRQAQKMEAIGQLSSGVAHDFNNLLGGIMGHAELLKFDLNPASSTHRHANEIISICQKAAMLTKQLLSFARKSPFILQKIMLTDFMKQFESLINRTVGRSIEISLKLPEQNLYISGDLNQFENALLNIAINARDAMPGGGRFSIEIKQVHLSAESFEKEYFDVKDGDYAKISLADTGTGMTEDVKARIFEPFFTTKDIGKGTGLGLPSVFGYVKQNHGYITVTTKVNKGTRFDLYFPLISPSDEVTVVNENDTPASGQGSILFVDDELIYHEIITKLLGKLGYKVHCFDNGHEAVMFYRDNYKAITLAVLDMCMPRMGGFECFKELRQINPSLLVIIASGYGETHELTTLLKEKGCIFLQKPFKVKELRCKIAELTGV